MVGSSDERPFDVIPFEDIQGGWKKLGSGSFGNVYKGTYLGIEVAIKEVLPSSDYDVSKYFEREWRLMKECRHPNVVLYLGLSRAPDPDNRIFIISEYIENGNLRQYIHDKSKPFPWKLRISFATDIARALAYLHARRCLHRDLKGENLLVTSNGRLKMTDFGFARIAARNAEESKRLTFCGTDAYMSPEILLGEEFDLPTDVYSLGIILCEIGARKLADDRTFKRAAPSYGIDPSEAKRLMNESPGCPSAFTQLALECLADDPAQRPVVVQILEKLRDIELEVLARPSEGDDVHVGSVKFITGHKRPASAPRIPSFGMGVGKEIAYNGKKDQDSSDDETDSDDERLIEAMRKIEVDIDGASHRALLNGSEGRDSDYSTAVPTDNGQDTVRLPTSASSRSVDSFHTASSLVSIAAATEGGSLNASTIRGPGATPSTLIHRFTLIKPGVKRQVYAPASPSKGARARASSPSKNDEPVDGQVWGPFGFFFTSTFAAKCDICAKRLGWKPVLECDDCGLRAHIKCGEVAPMDCGIRPIRPRAPQAFPPGSPLSRAKHMGRSEASPGSPSPLTRR